MQVNRYWHYSVRSGWSLNTLLITFLFWCQSGVFFNRAKFLYYEEAGCLLYRRVLWWSLIDFVSVNFLVSVSGKTLGNSYKTRGLVRHQRIRQCLEFGRHWLHCIISLSPSSQTTDFLNFLSQGNIGALFCNVSTRSVITWLQASPRRSQSGGWFVQAGWLAGCSVLLKTTSTHC